jgi:hypothetical protein
MPTFSQLPSGKWRVQVRRLGLYRAASFETKRKAKDWAAGIESQANHIVAGGFAPVPKGSTVADLINKYSETPAKVIVVNHALRQGPQVRGARGLASQVKKPPKGGAKAARKLTDEQLAGLRYRRTAGSVPLSFRRHSGVV